jgi:hypothetical protein
MNSSEPTSQICFPFDFWTRKALNQYRFTGIDRVAGGYVTHQGLKIAIIPK